MKKDRPPPNDRAAFEQATAAGANARYVLRLFVTGHSALSNRAIVNIRKICEENLAGYYELEVVDVSKHPEIAIAEQIVAAPTLIKQLPEPLRRFIGDMSQTERILVGLDVRKDKSASAP